MDRDGGGGGFSAAGCGALFGAYTSAASDNLRFLRLHLELVLTLVITEWLSVQLQHGGAVQGCDCGAGQRCNVRPLEPGVLRD